MSDEVKIIGIEVDETITDIGKDTAKAMPAYTRWRYKVDATYLLDDGRKIPTAITGLTKPKLRGKIESTQRHIEQGAMSAVFMDGKYWGTRTRLTLFG